MTEDQEMRMSILEICKGSTSEAKMAYYWVMGDQSGTKAANSNKANNAGQIGRLDQDHQMPARLISREQELREHAAMEATLLAQRANERNPYIGGGSSN